MILACDEGTYGFDCNETCGHCRDVSQCSNTNGTCLNGCVASYKGDMCESSEKIFGRFNLSQIDKQLDGFCDIMKD